MEKGADEGKEERKRRDDRELSKVERWKEGRKDKEREKRGEKEAKRCKKEERMGRKKEGKPVKREKE